MTVKKTDNKQEEIKEVSETRENPKASPKKTPSHVQIRYTPFARNHKAGSIETVDAKTAENRIKSGVATKV